MDIDGSGSHPLSADELSSTAIEGRMDSLVGKIAAEVARDIADGTLAPGADINSVELSARFGTSRTPVREALMLLEKEGLVDIPPRRRPRVAVIRLEELEELYKIRAVLNGFMIREFIARASGTDLDALQAFYDAAGKAAATGEGDEVFAHLNAIHVHCLQRCGNSSLIKLLGSWKMRMSVRRLVGNSPARLERSLLDHQRLVMACRDRDPALAAALIEAMTLFGLSVIMRQQHAVKDRAPAAPQKRRKGRPSLKIV